MSHINAGVNILSEIRSSDEKGPSHGSLTISSHPFIELAHLEVLFNRLDSQVVQMMGSRPMTLGRICKDNAVGFCDNIPPCFNNLEEARNSFDYHWNGCLQIFNDADLANESQRKLEMYQPEREKYLKLFRQWDASFQNFLRKYGHTFDSKTWQGARVVQILHIFAATNVEACPVTDTGEETVWDQFLPRYKHMLDLAMEVIDTLQREVKAAGGRPSPCFSLDMNFVAPLYAVTHKCRDPVLRRQAVNLLYASPRQEGIWDSYLAARVAERLISIEEEGLGVITSCADVPDTARLNTVDVKFDLGSRLAIIKYCRMTSLHMSKRQDFVEKLEW